MPLHNPVPAPEREFTNLAEYVGRVLIFEPIEVSVQKDTKFGDRPIVVASVSVWHEGEKYIEGLGQHNVFWSSVRAQLEEALENHKTVAGRLMRKGRAYELEPLDPATLTAAEKAYEAF
jgi:hypothetical protein